MNKVIAWSGGWQGGKRVELETGRTYYEADLRALGVCPIKSLHVPDEVKVTCDRWGDMKWGNPWDRVILYPNPSYYEDTGYWLEGGFRAIKTEKAAGIKASEVVRVYQDAAWHYQRGPYGPYWCCPVGTTKAEHREFLFDVITDVQIPEGLTATFIDWNPKLGGKCARTLYPGVHSLADYGLNDRVDDVQVTADKYEYVETRYGSIGDAEDDGVLCILEQSLDNAKGTKDFAGTLEFSKDFAASVTRKWENSSGIEVSVEVGTGENSPVSAKFGITVSNTFTVGKESANEETTHVAQSVQGTAGPGEIVRYGLTVVRKKAKAQFTVVLRNKRDGSELHRSGVDTVRFAQAGDARVIDTRKAAS